jgi:hypothetical protein
MEGLSVVSAYYIMTTLSVATYAKPLSGNGVIFDDVWEPLVLSCFTLALVLEQDPHCQPQCWRATQVD